MHPYATDSPERRVVPLLLAAMAILAAWTLPSVLAWLGLSVPWWIDAPSVVGFYTFLHGVFNRWAWKWRPLRWVGLVRVPDLGGEWECRLVSSFKKNTEVDARVTIHQTWQGLQVRLETPQSRSVSRLGSIMIEDPSEFLLNYEFLNTPKQGSAVGTMHAHRGSVEIRFPRRGKIDGGSGEYYNGRDRENQGQFLIRRGLPD